MLPLTRSPCHVHDSRCGSCQNKLRITRVPLLHGARRYCTLLHTQCCAARVPHGEAIISSSSNPPEAAAAAGAATAGAAAAGAAAAGSAAAGTRYAWPRQREAAWAQAATTGNGHTINAQNLCLTMCKT